MKKIDKVDTRTLREKLVAVLFYATNYGVKRREELVTLIKEWQQTYPEDGGIRVNARHCVILNKDPDLLHLIKHNKAKLIRVQQSKHTRYTYLHVIE